jgi:hypothetical protein
VMTVGSATVYAGLTLAKAGSLSEADAPFD